MASLGDTGGEAPTIRIVRKKKGGEGHHGGAWKVAYADFVTAMMAFFLVMWIVGLSKPARLAISAYFKNPSLFATTGGAKLPVGSENPPNVSPPPVLSKSQIKEVEKVLNRAKAAILRDVRDNEEFRNLSDSIQVSITNEGLRIELIEKRSALFFAPGSATLNPTTVRLLQVIAHELRDVKNPLVIEGHTDSQPLNGPNGYSNWELSADRANAARKAMEEHGLRPHQVLGVRGFADRKLLRPDDPTHFSNRRVSILVPFDGAGE